MTKKILGAILLLYSSLSFLGAIAGENLNITTLIIQIVIALSGIFLFFFDRVYKKSCIEGFKARKKQCAIIIFFMIFDLLLIVGTMAGLFVLQTRGVYYSTAAFVLICAISYVPFIIYWGMFATYVLPYKASRKYFLENDTTVNEYLTAQFKSFSQNDSVLANDKLLFFPKLYCVIPKAQIDSVKLKKVLFEQDVYFYLTNGKKFYIVSRQYDNIMTALDKSKVPADM